jgi:hypothetical protein
MGVVLAKRPHLVPAAVRLGVNLVPRRWWRRRPFLPLPDPDWLAFRMEVAYGDAGAIPPAGGVLLTTDDGGLRWHRLAAPAGVQTVCFTDRERGWLGAGGRIYSTLNGGRSWTLAVRGPYGTARFPGLAEVECAGPGAAWC